MAEIVAGEESPQVAEGVLITFERVGRDRNVQPLQVSSLHEEVIRERVYAYVRPFLKSNEVSVYVNFSTMLVEITAGAGSAGKGTMQYTPIGAVAPQE